ncbi:hypothetical protein ASPZODRAFT_1863333 [Penicilliopsis zonata CBS 506.65]|uniref:Alkaline ceramidase n=1 Tax=Penicilliopsis zonata CBS 506.65 TaxID=1073090 RepID=A0A1L9SIA9_9EURO|nr:hypothetical protein ASPZODRAFT_1863333 [Penicilliopsis zonata CBS 506.65]OJJ46962.1 hypothetical protein ASPZODRAFT_1863333 [Penicilliopsis zonata CBS 506.65]
MFSDLPSLPYPPAGDGYWGSVTSTLNWCEEDYYATQYSAEIVNSLTNLIFVYLAAKGISSCLRNGHDRVFLVAFLSYLVIGLGSFCFHSTLKYPMQLLDELSMIYTACVLFYAVFSRGRSTLSAVVIGVSITALAAFITGYYHYLQNPVFHQNAFALLTAVVVLQSMYSMEKTLRPSRRRAAGDSSSRPAAEQARIDCRDTAILRNMWQMIACGLTSIAAGFLIWNLDNIFCPSLRRWRRDVGLPWGILAEGHGWWHIMTGIAAYFNLTWSIWLRYCLNGKQDEVELVWPSLFCVPIVERTRRKQQ